MLSCVVLFSLCSDSWQGEKINLAETCSPLKRKKKAVNNRNSIKLPSFPVSYALWTAQSDRVWRAERLVGYRSAPTTAQTALSWPRRTTAHLYLNQMRFGLFYRWV